MLARVSSEYEGVPLESERSCSSSSFVVAVEGSLRSINLLSVAMIRGRVLPGLIENLAEILLKVFRLFTMGSLGVGRCRGEGRGGGREEVEEMESSDSEDEEDTKSDRTRSGEVRDETHLYERGEGGRKGGKMVVEGGMQLGAGRGKVSGERVG